ncbi:unnamed protein product, partial [Hymenolepis diminuta]
QYSNLYVIVLVPVSARVSSICSRALGPDNLKLIINLVEKETVTKAHLSCKNESYSVVEIEAVMNVDTYELKDIDHEIPITCRLLIDFSLRGSDTEDLQFNVHKMRLSDLSSNLLDNQGRDATEWYGGTESTEDMYGTEITDA